MSKTRGERRAIKITKWKSKLRKLWYSHFFCDKIQEVKRKGWYKHYDDFPKGETWKDYEKDRFGVMCKNTRTICRDSKWLDIQEERKRNLKNRSLSKEDLVDIEEYYNNKTS